MDYNEYKNSNIKNQTKTQFSEFVEILRIDLREDNFNENYNNFKKAKKELKFSPAVKNDIFKISGGFCTICGIHTIQPKKSNINAYKTIGEACHIKSSSYFGPRGDIKTRVENPSFIKSKENGLWACSNCHKIIDDMEESKEIYSEEKLIEIKEKHSKKISEMTNSKINLDKIISLEDDNVSLNINIKKEEYNKIINDIEEKLVNEYSFFEYSKLLSNKTKNYNNKKITINSEEEIIVESKDGTSLSLKDLEELGFYNNPNFEVKNISCSTTIDNIIKPRLKEDKEQLFLVSFEKMIQLN